MKEYPFNFLDDLGIDTTEPPKDIIPTFAYVLRCVTDERNISILETRYNGATYQELGETFGISKQRVNAMLKDIIAKLPRYKEMLELGLEAYMAHTLDKRVAELSNMLSDDEKALVARESYAKGYKRGYEDAQTLSHANSADIDAIRGVEIETLALSVRSYNCFKNNDIKTLGDIIDLGDNLPTIRNFGKRCFHEIVGIFKTYGADVKSIFPRTCVKFEVE